MNILVISAFYHDSAARLVQDGRIIAAAKEERFTRKKHDFSFPKNAIDYCMQEGGLKITKKILFTVKDSKYKTFIAFLFFALR